MIALRLNLFRAAVVSSVLLVTTTRPVHAENHRLEVSLSRYMGGDCVDSSNGYVAGIYSNLRVSIWPAERSVDSTDYAGVLAWEWPANLQVVAGHYEQNDTVFVPDLSLTNQLELRFYIDMFQAVADSIWRVSGSSPSGVSRYIVPQFCFKYHLPASLIGQHICFRASYTSEQYGDLVSEEQACLTVWSPCSAMDTSRIRESFVEYAFDLGNWLQVVSIADSLKQLGWWTLGGSGKAQFAAERLGLYERALGYLDTTYVRFGKVIILEGMLDDTAGDRQMYEFTRGLLLERMQQR